MPADLGIPDVEEAVEIGRGGFGVVYKAHQTRFDRTIAVKVLEQAQLDEAGRQRFERECKALGALSGHPNVVTIYDSGFTPAGWPYLVLEYLPDGSLGDRLDRDGPCDIDTATELTIKIAGALETAHRIGVLHRDMKPENILMGPYDEPKLGDFGIARVQGATVTATSTIWGSPAHAAPEIIEGKGATIQTDIYSLGSTVYVLLSGRLAFQRDTDESIIPVLARIATEAPPDLRPVGVPDPVWAVVARAMAKSPADRQATALEFGTELQAARDAIGLPRAEMRVKGEPTTRRAGARSGALRTGEAPPLAGPQTTHQPQPYGPQTPAAYAAPYSPQPPSPTGGMGGYSPQPGTYGGSYAPQPTPYPGATSGPIDDGGTSNAVWYAAAAVLAVALVIALVVVVLATRDNRKAPPPTSVRSTGTISPATLKRGLINPKDVTGSTEWTVAEDFAGFNGFGFLEPCNDRLDTSTVAQEQYNLLQGRTSDGKDGRIFNAVAEFKSDDEARSFIKSLPQSLACDTWTDGDGVEHSVVSQKIDSPAGEDPLLFEDILKLDGDSYDHDYAFWRDGRFVGFVSNLTENPNDKGFTEELLSLGVRQLDQATA